MNINDLAEQISDWLTKNNLDKKIHNKEDLVDKLAIIFSNYDSPFNPNENPYLAFLKALTKSRAQAKIDFDDLLIFPILEQIQQLLDDGVITKEDISAPTSILFRKSLWMMNNLYKDIKFVVQAYYWLQDNKNLQDFFGTTDVDVKSIIFDKGTVRPASEIKKIIQEQDVAPEKETKEIETKAYTPKSKIKNLDKWKNVEDITDLTDEEANDLVSYLIGEYNLVN